MNTSEKDQCKRCGAVVPAQSTEKLCPACLMSGALEPTGSRAETLTSALGGSLPRFEYSEFPFTFGGYRLLGFLGSGGMGTVYEAEEIATGRRVALKMLGQQLDSPDLRQRFLREGRLAAGVNHPNSLYVFGSDEIEGVPVITMEIAGSGTLKDKIKKRGPMPVNKSVDAVLDVIAGLEAAFAAGVLHRDIKPSNCFVSPDGSVKVGDFGLSVSTLAKDDSYVTATGVIMGTPAYAPPEQLRGDELDVRADIYSVGATLFTLLTGQAPFEGQNAVQVVANAVNKKPRPLTEFRKDVPPALERVVDRCLAKEPQERFPDYVSLRNALLPFSSREPEPASIKVRASAGWIDYLIAFLVPYVVLMLTVGAKELLNRPVVEPSLYSARYYLALFISGFLYFSITEGLWGAGLGKYLKGLRVVRTNGRRPGMGRALIRILLPILSVEGVRMPLMMALISDVNLTGSEAAIFIIAANVCAWIPVLLTLTARRENGFATLWDLASGTRVVVKPEGAVRPSVAPVAQPKLSVEKGDSLGPFTIEKEIVPGKWIEVIDPVLRRQVWLRRRNTPELSRARRNLARQGRLRWLQKVETGEAVWDAFEATPGTPFSRLVEDGKRIPWPALRHWLHDLAAELWAATGDQTLPAELSLDYVWISARGHAVLLDEPWPDVDSPAQHISVGDTAGQQRFLHAVAAAVESTSLPLHAAPVLRNLGDGKFGKLSFLTGILQGLLDKPAEVSRGMRAGSIFMLPLYIWITLFVGVFTNEPAQQRYGLDPPVWALLIATTLVLGGCALIQLLEVPIRTTVGHSIFRLAIVNARGERAGISELLLRWAIAWLPLLLALSIVALLISSGVPATALTIAVVVLLLWLIAAFYAVLHPNRGLHDWFSGTWVVRR